MIVTEKEARERACVANPHGAGHNGKANKAQHPEGMITYPCLGALCMGWRWATPAPKPQFWRCLDRYATADIDPRPHYVPPEAAFEPYDGSNPGSCAGWSITPQNEDRQGFCGIGGVPLHPREG